MNLPSFQEDHISQVPALQVLMNLGYTYLRPQESYLERGGKYSNVILEGILEKQLQKMNRFMVKGQEHRFSRDNIRAAVQAIRNVPFDGLIRTNEKIYDLLTLGKSFDEEVDGIKKSPQLHYVDWKHPSNNVFHVCEEFEVARTQSDKTRRPDIVCFVNGIPLVVIECKRPDIKDPIKEAMSQHIRNQANDEIPKLFVYSQLLLSLSKNEAKFGTTGTALKFWSMWKEPNDVTNDVERVIKRHTPTAQRNALFAERYKYVEDYFAQLDAEGRMVTEQDKTLVGLCRPERLIELVYQFIVFEKAEKKIARYQQYFAVKKTMDRVTHVDDEGRRRGGVIWHTQGSGKSLTMVMLARALGLEPTIRAPKIVLVTDRIDLDDQIWKTFMRTGKSPERAKTGSHLLRLLEGDKASVITTVINKFEASVKRDYEETNPNIFVLVDESHRSQYGPIHVKMQQVLPNACYIGFTGTPLMKKERNTAERFGGMIDTYSIDDAVADKAVVPLLYEGRLVPQDINNEALDKSFGIVSENLSKDQKRDLKKKFATTDQINKAPSRQWFIANDISEHFSKNWQGTGFKAQLACDSKNSALRYKEYLDQFGNVSSEVLISGPDTREGNEDVYRVGTERVQAFWRTMMDRFGTEKAYNESIINSFKYDTEPEIIIVVDKLLTGFDAPRNTVLYVDRSLKEHTLLQAIARVNRIYDGKDFGYVIDYYGIIKELGKALDLYSALPEFDQEEIANALTDVREEISKLPQAYSELLDVFSSVKNKRDEEAYEVCLADDERRDTFYGKLSKFNRCLSIALSSVSFHRDVSHDTIKQYTEHLGFFLKLRVSVKKRYAETIDFKEYEDRVRKLVDNYVTSHDVEQITPQTNIFQREAFKKEVEKLETKASKADTIAYRTKKTISDKWEEDPFFYRKFSHILESTIAEYRAQRLSDADYLERVSDVMDNILNHHAENIPESLRHHEAAKAFFGALEDVLGNENETGAEKSDKLADAALEIDEIIKTHAKVHWQSDMDAQNKMRNDLDDFLYAYLDKLQWLLTLDELDELIENCITIAKNHYAR